MSFRDELWTAAAPIHEQILAHPFVTELASGELDRTRFRHYLVQDVQYIDGFVRVLGQVAARAPRRSDVAMLTRRAGEVAAEHELHDALSAGLGVTDEDVATTPLAPTARAYLDHLTATVSRDGFLASLSAVLACPWIYRKVGRELVADGSPDRLYDRWINRYGGERAPAVEPLLELADRAAQEAGQSERRSGVERFVTACRYEWMFFDMGYHRRGWPV